MSDLDDNPIFSLACMVQAGILNEITANRVCAGMSKALNLMADTSEEERDGIVRVIGFGQALLLPYGFFTAIMAAIRYRDLPRFKFVLFKHGVLKKVFGCLKGPQRLREKEELWASGMNTLVFAYESSDPRLAKVYSDLSLTAFAHKKGTELWADINMHRGRVCLTLGEYDSAWDHAAAAYNYYKENNIASKVIKCLALAYRLSIELGQYDRALAAIYEFKARSEDPGTLDEPIPWENLIASTVRHLADPDASQRLAEAAMSILFGGERPPAELLLRDFIAGSLQHKDQNHSLSDLIQAREELEHDNNQVDLITADLEIVAHLIEQSRYQEAGSMIEEIDSRVAHTNRSRSELARLMGRLSVRLGDVRKAEKHYAEAIKIIEDRLNLLTKQYMRAYYLESFQNTYEEFIGFLLDQGKHISALEYVETLKARTLNEDHVRRKNPNARIEAISFEEMCKLVPGHGTLLVEFFPTDNKMTVFIISDKGGGDSQTVCLDDYGQNRFLQDWSKIQDALTAEELRQSVEDVTNSLSEAVYSKIRPYLDGAEHIVLVPYGLLHQLPLHAMYSDESGQRLYLNEDHLVTYAPSAKNLRSCEHTKRGVNGDVIVASAVPDQDLFFSRFEANTVQRLYPGSKIILDATKKDFFNLLDSTSILHYTGHASPDGLILNGQTQETPVERLEWHEIADNLDLSQSYMVTLSACRTGFLSSALIDEVRGLPTAFMSVGAPTVISSLWPVSDLSTTLLMAKMYEGIRAGKGRAESLRQAQKWFKKSSREEHLDFMRDLGVEESDLTGGRLRDSLRFSRGIRWEKHLPEDLSHPYYWAGFICSGAP